jgi:hypothetical protein
LTTTVNIGTTVGAATTNIVGVNLAYWDDQLTTAQTQSMVEAAGLNIFRFPGGSASDDFHFNSDDNYSDPSANSIPQFAQFVDNVGGLAIVTIDYGSGSPQEAEAELAYLTGSPTDTTVIGNGQEWSDSTSSWQTVNWQTVGYWASLRGATPLGTNDGLNFLRVNHPAPYTGLNYWEIGNEQYGTWEIDHYSPTGVGGSSTTGGYNYPQAYALFAATFSAFVKADKSLPSILIGIDSEDPTGASDNDWTQNVLTYGLADGFVPGFISDHSYMYGPGQESDTVLLNDTVSNPASILDWSTRYTDYENLLDETVGATNAASVHVMATEYNSNYGVEGKQMTSLVNGLFVADSIGSLLDSGYTGGLFWDLRNGWTTDGNNSPTLYGWREGGDEGILGDPNLYDPPSTGPYITYPNYFGEELGSKLIQTGATGVSAVSNYNELAVYSVLEANGHLDLMVINKNPDAAITEQFNLQGFTPSGQAQFWQYGEAQDYAQSQSPTGAASLANFSTMLGFTGDSFSYAFPAYSMTVIDLTPMVSVAQAAAAAQNPVTGTSVALSALGSENGTGSGLTYTWSATGPAPVTYTGNTNGTNAAASIIANFTQAGVYNFTATITDPSGQMITTSVPITVQQTPTTIAVSPNSSPVVPIGFTQQFSATTTDQFGNAISSPAFTWTIGGPGNSISTAGNATLGTTPGTYTVTAADGTAQGTASVISEDFAVPAASTLDINLSSAGPVSLSAVGSNITAAQNGVQITLSGYTAVTVTDTGTADTLNFNGLLAIPFTFVNSSGSTINVNNGSLLFAANMGSTINLGTLMIANGAAAMMTAATTNTPTILTLSNLSVAPMGQLDVANNEVLINYGAGPDPITTIAGWIATGYTAAWTGPGIISSIAQTNPNYGLGYADGADGVVAGLTSGQIEILYTLLGDANLDGTVNAEDYTLFSEHIGQTGMMWDDGDFNYDGTVNAEDYTLLSENLGQSSQIAASTIKQASTLVSNISTNLLPKTHAAKKPKHLTRD